MTPKLRSIVAEQLGCSQDLVVPEARLIEDLGADSLDLWAIVVAIEKEFNFDVPDEDAEKLKTFGLKYYPEVYVKGIKAKEANNPKVAQCVRNIDKLSNGQGYAGYGEIASWEYCDWMRKRETGEIK